MNAATAPIPVRCMQAGFDLTFITVLIYNQMKKIFAILFLLFSHGVFGQKIALLSHDFKKPILYTDSITVEQIANGYFAVKLNDFDTLIGSLNYLKNALVGLSRAKMQSWEFRAGNTTLKTTIELHAYGDKYNVVAISTFDEIKSVFTITTEKNNKRNSKRLEELMQYIAKNRSIFKEAYEINPKFYNVVIIKEN